MPSQSLSCHSPMLQSTQLQGLGGFLLGGLSLLSVYCYCFYRVTQHVGGMVGQSRLCSVAHRVRCHVRSRGTLLYVRSHQGGRPRETVCPYVSSSAIIGFHRVNLHEDYQGKHVELKQCSENSTPCKLARFILALNAL